jgi:hypothetical protein
MSATWVLRSVRCAAHSRAESTVRGRHISQSGGDVYEQARVSSSDVAGHRVTACNGQRGSSQHQLHGRRSGLPPRRTDLAGNPNVPDCFTANWNNAVGTTGSGLSLVDSANAATSLLLSYSTGLGTWSIPDTTTGANHQAEPTPR